MNVLFLLIPVSLILLVLAVAVFFWAVRSGQFDDLDTPAYRILMDTDEARRREQDHVRDDRDTTAGGAERPANSTHRRE